MRKDDLNVHVFQNKNWGPFHRKAFQWKKYGDTATSSYSATDDFFLFILCLWQRIIRRSNQGVYFMNYSSQIFFNDINHGYREVSLKKNSLWLLPFYAVVASYCYYEKVRRKMNTAIASYLLSIFILFQLQSWIILRMRSKFCLGIFIWREWWRRYWTAVYLVGYITTIFL